MLKGEGDVKKHFDVTTNAKEIEDYSDQSGVNHKALEELSDSERDAFLRTGELPPLQPERRKDKQERERQPGGDNTAHERIRRGREKYHDFDQVVVEQAKNIQLPLAALEELGRLDNDHDVVYAIAKNPAIAAGLLRDPQNAAAKIRDFAGELSYRSHRNRERHERAMQESLRGQPVTPEEQRGGAMLALSSRVRDAILDLPNSVEVTRYLARNAGDFLRSGPLTDAQAINEIQRISSRLEPRRITNAGKPPAEIGGSHSSPRDEVEAALQRKDGEAYREAMNARDREKWRARRRRAKI
jgi:hypothetical protein